VYDRRAAVRGTLVGVFAVVVLVGLLWVGPALAAPTLGPIGPHGPPFGGTVHSGKSLTTTGCGAMAAFTVPPSFKLSTGIGHVSSKSSAKGCGPPGFSDYGATEAALGFDSKTFNWSSPASADLLVNYTLNYTANVSATLSGPAGGPSAWATCVVTVYTLLYDVTTSSVAVSSVVQTSTVSNGSATGYVNASWNVPESLTFIPANLTSGHEYFVSIWAVATATTWAPSHTATSATAKLTMAPGAHRFQVYAWDIT
jgi:hypothetical protein